MNAIRTHNSNATLAPPPDMLECDPLPIQVSRNQQGSLLLSSVWEPTDLERQAITSGANVMIHVWGSAHPPVAVEVTNDRKIER